MSVQQRAFTAGQAQPADPNIVLEWQQPRDEPSDKSRLAMLAVLGDNALARRMKLGHLAIGAVLAAVAAIALGWSIVARQHDWAATGVEPFAVVMPVRAAPTEAPRQSLAPPSPIEPDTPAAITTAPLAGHAAGASAAPKPAVSLAPNGSTADSGASSPPDPSSGSTEQGELQPAARRPLSRNRAATTVKNRDWVQSIFDN